MFENFKKIKFNFDVEINGLVSGTGPPLLLLHGYPQNLYEWAKVAPMLAQKSTVVCADLRGYGESGKPAAISENYSFRKMAEDQIKTMEALGFHEFSVIGHDRGARVAFELAANHPRRVKKLGLLDIVPTEVIFSDVNSEIAVDYWHWFLFQQPFPYVEKIIESAGPHFFERFFTSIGGMASIELSGEQFTEYRRQWTDFEFIRASCAEYRENAKITQQARRIPVPPLDCPTLVAWGIDGALPKHFDVRDLWGARLNSASFVEMPGGHFFIDQFPNETAKVIEEFLGVM